MDLLCTKRQDVVYDIFNWSSNEESRVSVLAIANTLDLPERLLSRRVGSRLVSQFKFALSINFTRGLLQLA